MFGNGKARTRNGYELIRHAMDLQCYDSNGCANLGIAMLRHGNDGIGRAKRGDGTEESCLVKAWT